MKDPPYDWYLYKLSGQTEVNAGYTKMDPEKFTKIVADTVYSWWEHRFPTMDYKVFHADVGTITTVGRSRWTVATHADKESAMLAIVVSCTPIIDSQFDVTFYRGGGQSIVSVRTDMEYDYPRISRITHYVHTLLNYNLALARANCPIAAFEVTAELHFAAFANLCVTLGCKGRHVASQDAKAKMG